MWIRTSFIDLPLLSLVALFLPCVSGAFVNIVVNGAPYDPRGTDSFNNITQRSGTTPSQTSHPRLISRDASSSSGASHLDRSAIVGIGITGALFAILVVGCSIKYWRRYQRGKLPPSAQFLQSVAKQAEGGETGVAMAENVTTPVSPETRARGEDARRSSRSQVLASQKPRAVRTSTSTSTPTGRERVVSFEPDLHTPPTERHMSKPRTTGAGSSRPRSSDQLSEDRAPKNARATTESPLAGPSTLTTHRKHEPSHGTIEEVSR